jgi:hypothetical protein
MDSMEPEGIWINARTNVTTELAAEENKKKEGIPIGKLVPEEYHKDLDIGLSKIMSIFKYTQIIFEYYEYNTL